MSKIGFVGLGIMGKPMATHLLAAGHTLATCVHTNRAPIQELASKGATVCRCCKEIGSKSDIVFIVVPETKDVESVIFGEDGLAEGLKPGSIVVDMSSISPTATKEFASRLADTGVEMLDAPVSGGEAGARNGTLSIMVGGKPEIFERVKPFFETMGKNIVYIGGNGDGQTCKVANQIAVGLTLEAISEALLFASKAGADPEKVREALLGGFAQSRILEVHGERMIKRTFAPGFRVQLHQKDLNLALQGAGELGLSLPGTALALQLFNAVAAQGGKDLDHSAMVTALETLAAYEIST